MGPPGPNAEIGSELKEFDELKELNGLKELLMLDVIVGRKKASGIRIVEEPEE